MFVVPVWYYDLVFVKSAQCILLFERSSGGRMYSYDEGRSVGVVAFGAAVVVGCHIS